MVVEAAAGHKPSSQRKLLIVELMRCLGYFKLENTVFKRSLASEKLNVSKMKINDVLDLKHSSQ